MSCPSARGFLGEYFILTGFRELLDPLLDMLLCWRSDFASAIIGDRACNQFEQRFVHRFILAAATLACHRKYKNPSVLAEKPRGHGSGDASGIWPRFPPLQLMHSAPGALGPRVGPSAALCDAPASALLTAGLVNGARCAPVGTPISQHDHGRHAAIQADHAETR